MKTEFAFERQRKVVFGLALALAVNTARFMAGCFEQCQRKISLACWSTDEGHDLESAFDILPLPASGVVFTQGLCTMSNISIVVDINCDIVVGIHQICPLHFILESLHFAPQIRREHLEDPSVCVLICQRPAASEHKTSKDATFEAYQSKSKTMSCFSTDGSMSCASKGVTRAGKSEEVT